MPYRNHTSSPNYIQLDHQPLVSPSNIKSIPTCLHDDPTIRSVPLTDNSSPRTSVCQPRQTTQNSLNDAFTFSNPKTGQGNQPSKDFKLLKKQDVTTQEEFEALPMNIQKKVCNFTK